MVLLRNVARDRTMCSCGVTLSKSPISRGCADGEGDFKPMAYPRGWRTVRTTVIFILVLGLLSDVVMSQGGQSENKQGRGVRQGNRNRKQGKPRDSPQEDDAPPPTLAPAMDAPPPLPQPSPTVPCNLRNKCERRGNDSLSFHAVNCFCDDLCQVYEDCCKDFTPTAPTSYRVPKRSLDCQRDHLLHKKHEVYIVNRCPKGYKDKFVLNNCQEQSMRDRFLQLPVTSGDTGVLYRNYYCALCSDDTGNVLFWRPKLTCGDNPLENMAQGSNATQQIARETLDDSLTDPGKHGCRVEEYVHPIDPRIKPRRCKSNFDKCDRSWTDKTVEKKCKKFTSYVYVHLKVFRNKYCGMCNYVNETYLSCEDMRTPREGEEECPFGDCSAPPPPDFPPPLSILLDINDGFGKLESSRTGQAGSYQVTETTVETRKCPLGQVRDPFTRSCRVIFCPGGLVFREGRCVASEGDEGQQGTPGEVDDGGEGSVSVGEQTTSETTREQTTPKASTAEFVRKTTTTTAPTTSTSTLATTLSTIRAPLTTLISTTSSTSTGTSTTERAIYTTNPTDSRENWQPGDNDQTTDKSKDSQISPEAMFPPTVLTGAISLDCPLVAYNNTEYNLLKNLSVEVYSLARVYQASQYLISGTQLYICAPYLEREYNVTTNVTYTVIMFKFSRIQSLMSYVGLLISLVSLLILIVIYLMLTPLRNLAGKCVISLAVSLFLAQLIFLTGSARKFTDMPPVCLAMGALMHYFFLVAFIWMNVLAIDISRTFIRANTCGTSSEPGPARFAAYSLYAWLVPALIVGGAIALDFYGDAVDWLETLRPYYGDGLCWITKREALLYLFAVPLALLLFINIILFAVTIKHIVSISRAAKAAVKQDKDRGRFILYIKLTVIMGLTWVFGFLAALAENHVLWYVFIVLNTLQGAFICFAFVCTRRVFRLLSEKGRVHRSTEATTSAAAIGNGRYGNNYSNTRYGQYTRPTQYFETQSKIISQETSI